MYQPAPQSLIVHEIYYKKKTIEDEYDDHSSVSVIKYFNDCICSIDARIGVNWDYKLYLLNAYFDNPIFS